MSKTAIMWEDGARFLLELQQAGQEATGANSNVGNPS